MIEFLGLCVIKLIYYGFFLYVFLIGEQIIVKHNYIDNYIFIFDLSEEYRDILKKTKVPFDGWFVTLIICFIPILNIMYILFFTLLGLASKDNYIILQMREAAREIK